MTLVELLRRATGYLEEHGADSPRLDAELLLAHSLGLRRLDLYLQHDRELAEPQLEPYRALIRRRAEGEPVAYLIGRKEFMGLDLEVTPAVLVPNPDTEVLVQLAIAFARQRGGELRFADIGTGSGAIAVSLAHYVPGVSVTAVDSEAGALEIAARNVRRHALEERVTLVHGNLLDPVTGEFDAILANLPYLSSELKLQMEVEAQPAAALFAGPNGGELVEKLLRAAPSHLAAGAILLAEIDPVVVSELVPVAAELYRVHRVHRDLGGHERVLEVGEPL